MSKKLFITKEEYDLALEQLSLGPQPKLPAPQYPKEFPALLISDIKFHRLHESSQIWVYPSDFDIDHCAKMKFKQKPVCQVCNGQGYYACGSNVMIVNCPFCQTGRSITEIQEMMRKS